MPRPPADAPLLNLELICRTALRLIDDEGLEALSMRKLAATLKVTPRSLYHYVPTKDALLRLVYIDVLGELELPDPERGTWQENLRTLAHSFRALCHRHRNVAPYFWGGHEPVREDNVIVERLFTLLLEAGLPPERVTPTGHALIVFIVGYILSELGGSYSAEGLEARRTLARETPEYYPTLLSLPVTPGTSVGEGFEVALELLIAGVEGSTAASK
jgi:AcrR family transcriptional regulator